MTHRGRPVPGAWVRGTRFEAAFDDRMLAFDGAAEAWRPDGTYAQSGQDGGFALPFEEHGRMGLVVAHSAYGHAVVSAFTLEPGVGGPFVEVDLPGVGAAEGTVLLPDGVDPSDLWLRVEVGNDAYTTGVGRDGYWRAESLAAESVVVRAVQVVDKDLEPGAKRRQFHGPETRPPAWLSEQRIFEIPIVPGETTRFDIDLRNPAPSRLEGRVVFDGRARTEDQKWRFSYFGSGYPQRVELTRSGGNAGATGRVDAEGRFVLGVSEPGTYRLELVCSLQASRLKVFEEVTLGPGPNPWRWDVPTGAVQVRAGPKSVDASLLRYVWDGGGARRAYASVTLRNGRGLARNGARGGRPDRG